MDTQSDPSPAEKRAWLVPVLALAGTLVILTAILMWLAHTTRERIAANQQSGVTAGLQALMPPSSYDNDLLTDTIEVTAPDFLGTSRPVTVYRARRDGRPVAAIVRPIAPDGYRGPIELLVAISYDGTLIGVQVLRHHETPGLGDAFEQREAHWLDAFRGLSLENPPQQRWTVRRDGGEFDAFTGATITPRAIVKAVRRSLEFYRANRERLFE
jgi:electron transport complex protein RnfG